MLERLLAGSNSFRKISNPETKDLIAAFFRSFYETGTSFLKNRETPRNPYTTYKTHINCLSKAFRDVSIEECKKTETCLALIPYAGEFPRTFELFWLHISKNLNGCDEAFGRLRDFEDIIYSVNMAPGNLKLILTDAAYERFHTSRYYGNLSVRIYYQTYFFNPQLDFLEGNPIRSLAVSYFNDLRFGEKYSVSGLISAQLAGRKAMRLLFGKRESENLDRGKILEIIRANAEDVKVCHAVSEILTYFYSAGVEFPDKIGPMSELLTRMGKASLKDYERLCGDAFVERWRLIPYSNESAARPKPAMRLLYVNYPYEGIRNILSSFFTDYGHNHKSIAELYGLFEDSLAPYAPKRVEDFNYKTYFAQLNYVCQRTPDDKICLCAVTSFYLYLWRNHNPDLFKGDFISPSILLRPDIGMLLTSGYEIINYTRMEQPPSADKWILYYADMARSNSEVGSGAFNILVDFTDIECPLYRDYAKRWLWWRDVELIGKRNDLISIREALNYIYALKEGRELSVYAQPTASLDISVGEILAWKFWTLERYKNNRTRNHMIYALRNFMAFLADNGIGGVESGVFYHLTHTLNQDYDNAKALSNEELSKLALVMKKKAESGGVARLYLAAFYIALETELRPSQIFSLRKDCVRETAKREEYVLFSRSKTSHGEFNEYPVTKYVKREIDAALRESEELRESDVSEVLSDYLFIAPRKRKGYCRLLTPAQFNGHMSLCCREAGIPRYTIANLRDTHMTRAEEETIRRSLSDVRLRVLTGHKNSASDGPYIDRSIRSMLEATHGVIIGDVDAKGSVLPFLTDKMTRENEVSNSCGYCVADSCADFSYVDCLLCEHFVTVPARLPYFKERVRRIDALIPESAVPHDKEDLLSIKRLLLYYIEKLTEAMKRGTQ